MIDNTTTASSVVSRAALLEDELTRAISAYVNSPSEETLGNYSAALVGRCSSMAASAVVTLYERVADLKERLTVLEERVRAVEERAASLEAAYDGE